MSVDKSVLFQQDGMPAIGDLIPLSLQHVVAAVVGIITPSIIVANVCGLTVDERTLLVQAALVLAGVVTLLQAHPLFGRLGSGLPVIMGSAFAYVPTLTSIGAQFGIGAILGAELIGGVVAIVFGLAFKYIRKLFPPVVTGTVVLCIGISLYTVAIAYMAGGNGSADFGSAQNWIVAIVTLVACVFFANFTKGVLKLGSLLFGMLVGYAVALAFGMVNFDSVVSESWVRLPAIMPFEFQFVPSAIASVAIVFVVASVETIGNFTGASVGGLDREPTDKELTGGLVSQGIMTILGSFVGAMPTSTYGQNVGIVTTNRVVNRTVFTVAAGILIVAGLAPKFAAVLSGIPQAVIGGATVTVFGSIAMTGIRMLTQGGLGPRKSTIAGLSLALGMGIALTEGALAGPGMPAAINDILGESAIVITTLCAILLNLVLPKLPEDNPAIQAAEEASQTLEEAEAVIYDSFAKSKEPEAASIAEDAVVHEPDESPRQQTRD